VHERATRAPSMARTSYSLMVVFGLSVGLPGPATPSLQEAYGLSYAGAALHLTMFSAGSGVASALDSRLSRRFGRRPLVRAALVGVAVGAMISGLAPTAAMSVAGITVMGFCGTIAVNIAHGVLGSEHLEDRGTALVNAHLFAAVGLVLAAVSVATARGLGAWRLAFAVPVVLVAAILVRRMPARLPPRAPEQDGATSARTAIPAAVWIGGIVLALSVAVEWAVTFWAASFLRDPLGLSDALADGATVAVLAALVVGRWLLSRMTRRWQAGTLLRWAFLVTIAASAPYLLGARLQAPLDVVVPIAALTVLCMTVTMLFPLSLAVAMDATDASDARQQQASAVAMALGAVGAIATPYLLGAIGDATTLTTALTVLPSASVVALLGIAAQHRAARRGVVMVDAP
jgi:fucose permease